MTPTEVMNFESHHRMSQWTRRKRDQILRSGEEPLIALKYARSLIVDSERYISQHDAATAGGRRTSVTSPHASRFNLFGALDRAIFILDLPQAARDARDSRFNGEANTVGYIHGDLNQEEALRALDEAIRIQTDNLEIDPHFQNRRARASQA
ncbi:MAG: hypothetical protein OXC95_13800 [Dehalococcoidia bacterium]|nr:hypothetical protein [Dehalococcoidia bacterium]